MKHLKKTPEYLMGGMMSALTNRNNANRLDRESILGTGMAGLARRSGNRMKNNPLIASAMGIAEMGGKYKVMKKGGKGKTPFGMLSVKAGIDNNPNATQADRIAGATNQAAYGTYKKMEHGGMHDDPPNILQRLVQFFKEGRPFRKEMQDLEDEAFMDAESRREQRYEERFGPGGTREQRLREKAMNRAINEFYGQSSDPSNPGYISTKEIMNNPEEYSEMLDKIPDEVYQKHFGRLWDRSEFFRKLFFKSPDESEPTTPEEEKRDKLLEITREMGRGMMGGAAGMMGR